MEVEDVVPSHGGVDDAKVAGGFDMGIQSRVQDVQVASSFKTSMLQRRVFNDAKTSDIEVHVTVERANVRPPMSMTAESMSVAFRQHPWTSVKAVLQTLLLSAEGCRPSSKSAATSPESSRFARAGK